MSTQYFVPKYSPYEAMKPQMKERRSRPRHFVDWPVLIETMDVAGTPSRYTGTLCNISSRGAFAYITGHRLIGGRLKVSIKLPLDKNVWMSYTAQVVRLERAGLGMGVALRFDDKRPSFRTIEHEAS